MTDTMIPSALEHPPVYRFGGDVTEGDKSQRELLGGKGANLAEMCHMGLPVPAGFTITTEVCTYYSVTKGEYPTGCEESVETGLTHIEESLGKKFGDAEDPLLVSVRSGARVSMPGMMDTVLNLGLNPTTVEGLARKSGDPRFAWDAYRRFVQMYGDVVLGIHAEGEDGRNPFSVALDDLKAARGVKGDTDLTAEDLKGLVDTFKAIVKDKTGSEFPDDPRQQLWGSIAAVFGSWDNERAEVYRRMNDIPDDWGTAVNVMAMVFGNMGEDSGTGVAFTRDPATGEKVFYGEYLMNAQGEDVVAGLRTPEPIAGLEQTNAAAWQQLLDIQQKLEDHYGDMQDLEFTIESGRLFMLQCRAGKRTGMAALRIATDLVREGKIDRREAVKRVPPEALEQVLQPIFDTTEVKSARSGGRVLCKGLGAGPGAASGKIAFTPGKAEQFAAAGESCLLVRVETSPEDIKGMQASGGILTARGGMTSHAALVGRQMGKVCVVGAEALEIDYRSRTMTVNGQTFSEGDDLSLDGTTGEVIAGRLATSPSEVATALLETSEAAASAREGAAFHAFEALLSWADEIRRMDVRANADQPDQCRGAIAFGAQGVGLCRTEHMFFGEGKIDAVREMILADNLEDREAALAKLLPLQRKDFFGVFEAMGERPVTIRTLDPPLHEFLPHEDAAVEATAKQMGVTTETLKAKVEALHELNPMLGHRGCRLGMSYPEITRMQARAIFEAALDVYEQTGKAPSPEVMIPLVATPKELESQAAEVRAMAREVFAERGKELDYLVGTMIELPRAAIVADEIAHTAEFFSFGTNDLTQTTYGLSRDDTGRFLPFYIEEGVYPSDPFAQLDTTGVGKLMRLAVDGGKQTRDDLKLGICGEHGGDPSSIQFCEELGLAYVSCSPYRVPIARLAAAQATLGS